MSKGIELDSYRDQDGQRILRAVADELFNRIEIVQPHCGEQKEDGGVWRRQWTYTVVGLGHFWFCWEEWQDCGREYLKERDQQFARVLRELKREWNKKITENSQEDEDFEEYDGLEDIYKGTNVPYKM